MSMDHHSKDQDYLPQFHHSILPRNTTLHRCYEFEVTRAQVLKYLVNMLMFLKYRD